MNLFLDTSAIIKLYHHEKGTIKFFKFLDDVSEEIFLTMSDIARIEIHSAFLKKFREKQISHKNINEVFSY